MKIAFAFQKDSHFKAVHATALRLCEQYKCKPVFIGIDTDYLPDGNKKISYLRRDNLDCLVDYDYDYVVACLGGYLLNFVIRRLANTQTKVISIFPGIVSHYQLDAFISRLNADQVWLNSRADYELYSKICKVLRVKNNGLLYGMSWIDTSLPSDNERLYKKGKERAIFFEQTEIFPDEYSQRRLSKTLESIIRANPSVEFKYKIRDNSTEEYFILLRKYLNVFNNVSIVKNLNSYDILSTSYYLSVSSSALVEGLLTGKTCYIIDQKLLDVDGREFFEGSKILLDRFSLLNQAVINKKWFQNRLCKPTSCVDLTELGKNKNYSVQYNRNISQIRVLVLKLALYYPKLLTLVFTQTRLKSYQKSLEYLSTLSYE